jgi:uncharacterized repeat protein (TIGR03803 family)
MSSFKVIRSLQNLRAPGASRLQRRSSAYMKVCLLALVCASAALPSSAQTFRSLVNFDGPNGIGPTGSLIQGLDGNFYGTTEEGGAAVSCPVASCGTVFKATPGGTLTTLYNFCSQTDCTDGSQPGAGLLLGTNGNFYGTTGSGGVSSAACPQGCGTVFEITAGGVLRTLHSFHGTDGIYPDSLIQATNGNFYGTTSTDASPTAAGTIFTMSPAGLLNTLHVFDNTDGSFPYGALLQATDGNFYGTTANGGVNDQGVVYHIKPSGAFATIYSFCAVTGCSDGQQPNGGLIQGTNGNFYGTTTGGGQSTSCNGSGCGTVFEITLEGVLTTLHSFVVTDGQYPNNPLIQATDDNFYGMTRSGGNTTVCIDTRSTGCGTIFEITQAGTLTSLLSLLPSQGISPAGALFQGTNGYLYGGTAEGGPNNKACLDGCGTVFALSVGLTPFVESIPSYGVVGANIRILGSNLTGATGVTFNGTSATFTVVSGQYIQTTVPAGATTGSIQVTTPTATLTSNVAFTVQP